MFAILHVYEHIFLINNAYGERWIETEIMSLKRWNNINLIWNRQWSNQIEYIKIRTGECYFYTTSSFQYSSRLTVYSSNKKLLNIIQYQK